MQKYQKHPVDLRFFLMIQNTQLCVCMFDQTLFVIIITPPVLPIWTYTIIINMLYRSRYIKTYLVCKLILFLYIHN